MVIIGISNASMFWSLEHSDLGFFLNFELRVSNLSRCTIFIFEFFRDKFFDHFIIGNVGYGDMV